MLKKEVYIHKIRIEGNRVMATITINKEDNELFYEFPYNIEEKYIHPANALLVAFLPIAMRLNQDLRIDGEVSKRLLKNMAEFQEIMNKWYPEETSKVKIIVNDSYDDEIQKEGKVISCFTGGVDAFYSLIKNEKEIDDLLYVWGFDLPLSEEKFYSKIKRHLETVAKGFKKNLLLVKTNLGFEITNKYASWGDYCYGSAIASVIILMSDNYSKCFMPSCNDYSVLVPRGSHLLINHLFGCDGLNFIYDGAERNRSEKIEYIADNKMVQKHLRVCYKTNTDYNCCKCEKCVRTMASLEAVNKLGKVITFKEKLDLNIISNTVLNSPSELAFAKATMQIALKNKKKKLARELEKQIKAYEIKIIKTEILNNIDSLIEDYNFMTQTEKLAKWHTKYNKKYLLKNIAKNILKQ